MLMDWVGHHVDTAHWGLGFDNTGPVEVEGTGEFLRSHRVWNAPSRFQVKARYANGVMLEISGGTRLVLLACAIATVLFGVWQGPLVEAARIGAAALH